MNEQDFDFCPACGKLVEAGGDSGCVCGGGYEYENDFDAHQEERWGG